MRDVFICDAVRTPIGRFGGSLAKVRADDLAAAPIKALMERNPKADWGALYDPAVLGGADGPPVAALVSYEDIYVERRFSEATAAMMPPGRARLWVTNEFQHSGLGDDPSVFERLLAMSKGEVAIPS